MPNEQSQAVGQDQSATERFVLAAIAVFGLSVVATTLDLLFWPTDQNGYAAAPFELVEFGPLVFLKPLSPGTILVTSIGVVAISWFTLKVARGEPLDD